MPAIAGVEVIAAGPPDAVMSFTDALPPVHTTVTFVVITDDAGEVGVGAVESDSFGAFDLGPLEALRTMGPGLVGEDPYQPSAIAALARSRLPSSSRAVPCAAIEVACWDLLAQREGAPLWRVLGGARDEVPAYASLPFHREPAALHRILEQVVATGYGAAKLHVSGDPIIDVETVTGVREDFPTLELIVDAESVYDRRGAQLVGWALDELAIRWFEAPLPDRDLDGYQKLRQSIATPVVPAGGLVDDPREIERALRVKAWSAVRTQTMEGGVEHVRDLAALARRAGLDVELCSFGTSLTQAIDLHLILGLGLGSFFEQPYPVEPWAFGTRTPVVVENGTARAPDGPGLGLELDRDAIDDATLSRVSINRD
ncbi:MAG TPA: enolase C-terminal domain-like protein [Nocardioides sp.]|nr:enolase C-terminal domain-like protein [Nocardioides sp.]